MGPVRDRPELDEHEDDPILQRTADSLREQGMCTSVHSDAGCMEEVLDVADERERVHGDPAATQALVEAVLLARKQPPECSPEG